MFRLVRSRANSGSILGIAIRVPDVSTSKWVKIARLQVFGAPNEALNENSDHMWADEDSSAAKVTSGGRPDHRLKLASKGPRVYLSP
jgi:hypothetical protein